MCSGTSLPVGTPHQFLVQRGDHQIEVRVVLEAKSKEELAAGRQKNQKTAKENFDKGRAALEKGDYDLSIFYLDQAVQYKPADATYRDNLGYAYYKSGQKDLALKEFRKSTLLKPDAYYPHFHLGLIYYQKNNHQKYVRYEYMTDDLLRYEILKILSIKLLRKEIDEQTFHMLKKKLES